MSFKFRNIPTAWFMILLGGFVSCKTSTKSTGDGLGSSSLYDIKVPTDGTKLSNDDAVQEILRRQQGLQNQISGVMINGFMFYSGGYDSNADGAGAQFKTTCGIMIDGQNGCFRAGESNSISDNGMGQIPPSVNARLNDLILEEYKVILSSLQSGANDAGSYAKIEVRTSATVSGVIARKQVNKTNCLAVQGVDNSAAKSDFQFYDCGDSYYGRATRNGNLVALREFWGIEKS